MHRIFMVILGGACVVLAGCEGKAQDAAISSRFVRAVQVSETPYQPVAEISGEVKAQVQTDLSFRVIGKVIERNVDVGARIRAGEVLARIDDTEQQANVSIARAGLKSAQATVKQKTLTFDRYKALVESSTISRAAFDQAQEELTVAEASLQGAEANLATALDALSHTSLKADSDGIITARSIEVGQIVSAAQAAFTVARDGPRDAVFNVFESFFLTGHPMPDIDVTSLADRTLKVRGTIRDISPIIDADTGTIRVKVALPPSAQWLLGMSVAGTFRSPPQSGMALPASAMASFRGEPAVWKIDAGRRTVSLHKVSVSRYRTRDFIVTGGILPDDLIVTEGGMFLSEGQTVSWEGE